MPPADFVAEDRRVPVPMLLCCPACGERHIDRGEFATRVHHTHACQGCGMVWRPAIVPTVGVQFLPGFKDEEGSPRPDRLLEDDGPKQDEVETEEERFVVYDESRTAVPVQELVIAARIRTAIDAIVARLETQVSVAKSYKGDFHDGVAAGIMSALRELRNESVGLTKKIAGRA